MIEYEDGPQVVQEAAWSEGRELAHRAPVRHPTGDVRPLPRVGAFREAPPELVKRGAVEQHAVRVVVDERDAVQYFEKWPCCSNASSPSE